MKRFAAIATVVLSVGCAHTDREELVGTWVVASVKRRPDGPSQAGTLVLNRDGAFQANDLPYFPILLSDREDTRTSGRGTWKLVGSRWDQEVQLSFDQFDGRTGVPASFAFTGLECVGILRCDEIGYFVGDPDQVERVVFRKR